jgi:hypothetical protein
MHRSPGHSDHERERRGRTAHNFAHSRWFAGRHDRKVRVKVGDIEVEANTAADAEKLLRKAQEIAPSRKE